MLSDVAKSLTRIAPDGKVKWTMATPGRSKFEASPTGADGKIHFMSFAGEVVVVNAADGAILHQTMMGDPGDDATRAAIAIARGQLFIRTNTKLYCVGK